MGKTLTVALSGLRLPQAKARDRHESHGNSSACPENFVIDEIVMRAEVVENRKSVIQVASAKRAVEEMTAEIENVVGAQVLHRLHRLGKCSQASNVRT